MTDIDAARAAFDAALSDANTTDAAFGALLSFTEAVVGVRLFTVMTVDMAAGVVRRAFSSDPDNYPVSGTKPIVRDEWFIGVSEWRQPFVANTLADIAKVFPDHALIGALGCGAVINLPVFLDGVFVATVNMLHQEHHYHEGRVFLATTQLISAGEEVMRCNVGRGRPG
jgi:hypothetical protein